MIASAHVAAGAVAGMASAHCTRSDAGRVVLAFTFGLLTHVALDSVPHSDYVPLSRTLVLVVALLEIVTSGAVVARLVRGRLLPRWPAYLLVGIFGGTIPDVKVAAPLLLPSRLAGMVAEYGDWFHSLFHAPPPMSAWMGWTIEIACTLLLLTMLPHFPRPARADHHEERPNDG